MNLETYKQIEDSVKDAEYVLVGLGEEWSISYDEMLDSLKGEANAFYHLLKTVFEKDEYASLYTYFERFYHKYALPDKWASAYQNLNALLSDKDYYVISLTLDQHGVRNGLNRERVINPCGNYTYLQCANCKEELFFTDLLLKDCDESVRSILKENEGIDLESQLDFTAFFEELQEKLSKICCPNCGATLEFNNIASSCYNEASYLDKWQSYMNWMTKTVNRKLCIIEAGAGMTMPSVLRWPFEKATLYNKKATMYRIHHSFSQVNQDIADRSFGAKMNAVDMFETCKVKVDE